VSTQQIGFLVAAAVLVFWMVGAYNRLVSLRSAIGRAWRNVDELLKRRHAAADGLVAALREPMAAEAGALDALGAAQAQVQTAANALTARPVMAGLATAVVAAEAAWASASARVLALLEQHADLRTQPEVAVAVETLKDCAARLVFARQVFNEASQGYNEAARQLPTRLLTRMFGFGTAGRV
jgi:LemA protein